jgi:large subunit ribosomal protein L10
MNRDEKAHAIEEIAADIAAAEAIFAVDYRGISVPQAAELRGKLREADASFRVVKNRLTKIAAEKAGEDRLGELLAGPTALTFVRGDTAQAAKAISTFNKEHDVLTFKGGFMDGLSLDEDKFKSIARLPGREALNGQLAGVVASPLTGLVRGLGSMIQGLALQLGQIAEKELVSGESPAGPVEDEEPADAPTAGPVVDEGSSSSRDDAAGEDPSSTPPAEEASDEAAEDAKSEEQEAGSADAPSEEPPTESSAEKEPPAEKAPIEGSAEAEPPAEKEPSQAEGDEGDAASSGDEGAEEGSGDQETSDSADNDTSKEEE